MLARVMVLAVLVSPAPKVKVVPLLNWVQAVPLKT